jgi:hypothetical protein
MEQSELLIIALIGLLVWSIMLYFIIQGAVSSANKVNEHYLRVQNRLLIRLLQSQGVPKQEIIDCYDKNDEEFWGSLLG